MRTLLVLISLTIASGALAQGRGAAGGGGGGFGGGGAGMSGGMTGGMSGGMPGGLSSGPSSGGGREFGLGTATTHAAPQASGPLGVLSSETPGPGLGSAVAGQTYRNGLDANQPVKPSPQKPSLNNTSPKSLNGPL
jgi:hypothetical protein